ncbi:hypothetical protein ACFVYA_46515 [Amycolatopsis sp. NPDC058278]|uniref:hypothetical protein n=1 Tax=Amycolatopsis sp. NPDC058278 TaxID=3346417 RepID=UPI0036D86029
MGELERVGSSLALDFEGPPVLATFLVDTSLSSAEYVSRIRAVLSAAIRSADEISTGSEFLPEGNVPDWFAEVTRGSVSVGRDDPATQGVRQYASRGGEEPFELQEWLFCFDPELRAWSWWDATQISDESVMLWVDSSGEPVFPCEELRWLAYVCGATAVEGPVLRAFSEWRQIASTRRRG